MTQRDTLTKYAGYHLAKGKSYANLAKCYGAMSKAAKADMGADSDRESDIDTSEVSAELEALSACELDMASWCVTCCKALEADELRKAQGVRGDAIRPDAVSLIYKEDNFEHLRMVPRNGAPHGEDIPLSDSFKKVFGID